MGMFDWVRCTRELPGPDETTIKLDGDPQDSNQMFQTKDLECDLDVIEIMDNNEIWITPPSYGPGSIRYKRTDSEGFEFYTSVNGAFLTWDVLCDAQGLVTSITWRLPYHLTPEGIEEERNYQERKAAFEAMSPEEQAAVLRTQEENQGRLGALMADHLYEMANRSGFCRKFLAAGKFDPDVPDNKRKIIP